MATADPTDREPVTIIRYPNRRLYDRSQARYVTLQDVEDAICAGRTVEVRDSRSGEDLTRSVLTQLILERHPDRMDLFPVPLLHLIIRANDVLLGLLRESLRQSMQQAGSLPAPTPINPFALSQEWMRTFLPGVPSWSPAAGVPDDARDGLLRRIADLERRLDALQPAPPPEPAAKSDKKRGRKKDRRADD